MAVAMSSAMGNEAGAGAAPQGHGMRPNGRLASNGLSDNERNYAVFTHLSLFATPILFPLGCVAPIIMWLIQREKSAFIDDQGRELTNVIITGAMTTLALGFIPILGWIALIVWYVIIGIGAIRGAIAASRSEYFRYPM